jgi:hypothetical protein
MKEKELLRSYRFRTYLKELTMNRRVFKVLPGNIKSDILKGYREWLDNAVTLLPTKTVETKNE